MTLDGMPCCRSNTLVYLMEGTMRQLELELTIEDVPQVEEKKDDEVNRGCCVLNVCDSNDNFIVDILVTHDINLKD